MSLLSRGHESGFQAPGTSSGAAAQQHEQALAEGKQALLAPGATDTPLTHSLLDTMGYAHNPCSDSGTTCPIANRLLYNYTGAARTLLNPLEREAIHQKAAVDSYEQAKAYIVSSLFRIKDDAFRKVACCLVADYLGTQFLSQGAPQPEPAPPQPAPAWPDAHRPPAATDPAMAWAPTAPADAAPPLPDQQPPTDAQHHHQPHQHAPANPHLQAAAPPCTALPASSEGPGPHAAAHAKPAPASPSAPKHSSGVGGGGGGGGGGGPNPQSVHALAEAAAGVFMGGGAPAGAPAGGQPGAGGFMSDNFMNNHPHREGVALADAAT